MRYLFFWLLVIAGCLVRSAAAETKHAEMLSKTVSSNTAGAGKPSTDRLGGFAMVSKRILQDLIERRVTIKKTVAEPVLNMTTRGTLQVDCQIGLELVPNPRAANLRVTMAGGAVMNDAVSMMRSVRVSSSSGTRLSGHQDILFEPQGLRLLPASASGNTSIQVRDIEARRRLVERIAWRRAARMQPETEQAASGRAARRAEEQLETEVGRPMRELQREYVKGVRQLSDQGAFPDVRPAASR